MSSGKISRNHEMIARLRVWGELLDAAGWCVALMDSCGNPWLSPEAERELRSQGSMPATWPELLCGLACLTEEARHLDCMGIQVWIGLGQENPEPVPPPKLTPRETEILAWLRQGKTGQEIAIIVGCATRTVEEHMANLNRKLGFTNNAMAILHAPEARDLPKQVRLTRHPKGPNHDERQCLETDWRKLSAFLNARFHSKSANSLRNQDVQLLTELMKCRPRPRIARELGIRQDSLDRRLVTIREHLGLDTHRQLLSALAGLRNGKSPMIQDS